MYVCTHMTFPPFLRHLHLQLSQKHYLERYEAKIIRVGIVIMPLVNG